MHNHWRLPSLLLTSSLVVLACSNNDRRDGDVVAVNAPIVSGAGNAELIVQSDWTSGYCVDVVITNEGTSDITSWQLVVDANESEIKR